MYDKWLVGIITNLDQEEEHVQVKFMHSSGPSIYFQWPHVDDICWFFSILEHDRQLTEEQFLSVKQ